MIYHFCLSLDFAPQPWAGKSIARAIAPLSEYTPLCGTSPATGHITLCERPL